MNAIKATVKNRQAIVAVPEDRKRVVPRSLLWLLVSLHHLGAGH